MKLRQNARHLATRKALETPGVRTVAKNGLVRLHTRVFAARADPGRADERREHLDALFEATVETYLEALRAGYPEAEAREITHIQANFDFYGHGWTEMMEIPVDELETHYDRYREFFEIWGISIDDPLGEFEPPGGLPDAPATPGRLDDPDHPHAEAGFADDVYVAVDDGDGDGGDANVSRAVGVDSLADGEERGEDG